MEIVITGTRMFAEEVHRAKEAPASDLPTLTTEQKAVAKCFEISDERYARMELAARYGKERLRKAADAMARIIESELSKLVPGAELRTLVYEVGLEPHRILVGYKGKDLTFTFPPDDESEDYLRKLSKQIADSISSS